MYIEKCSGYSDKRLDCRANFGSVKFCKLFYIYTHYKYKGGLVPGPGDFEGARIAADFLF